MQSFKEHLTEELKDEKFKKNYSAQKAFLELSFQIVKIRKNKAMTQAVLAKKAGVTQRQLLKMEIGDTCNIQTLMKICAALGLTIQTKRKPAHPEIILR